MAGLVLVALIVMAIVFIVVSKNRKRTMLISVGVIGVYHLYVSYTCGPNSADVKVMKPMAEKISDYIVKNGIPKSLKDIPDLPYGLEGCESIDNTEKKCHYKTDDAYIVHVYTPITNELTVDIFNKNSRTGIQYYFLIKNHIVTLRKKGNGYSTKTSGICNPMKQ